MAAAVRRLVACALRVSLVCGMTVELMDANKSPAKAKIAPVGSDYGSERPSSCLARVWAGER